METVIIDRAKARDKTRTSAKTFKLAVREFRRRDLCVESEKSGDRAAHKGSALRKLG